VTWRECLDADGALDPAAAAAALRRARLSGTTFDVLLSAEVPLPLADAYRVQDQVTALRLAAGERVAGWKLGYTSAVMRAQMGVEAPNFGPLTDAMLLGSPALLPPVSGPCSSATRRQYRAPPSTRLCHVLVPELLQVG